MTTTRRKEPYRPAQTKVLELKARRVLCGSDPEFNGFDPITGGELE